MTYGEFLKSQGASDDEIKILDTPVARRAFDKMESERVDALALAATEVANREANTKWVNEQINPLYTKMQNEVVEARANEARARQALIEAERQGLVRVAEQLGYDPNPAAAAAAAAPADAKFMTREQVEAYVRGIATEEGTAIATVQDMAAEHSTLFPGQRLNWRDLLADARKQNKSVEQLWQERYKIPEARAAAEKSRADAHDAAIRKEERDKVAAEFAARTANPDLRTLSPSSFSFTPKTGTPHDKQPWEVPQGTRSNERVVRMATKIVGDMVKSA